VAASVASVGSSVKSNQRKNKSNAINYESKTIDWGEKFFGLKKKSAVLVATTTSISLPNSVLSGKF
jgi:hypothetical protein